MTVQQQMIFLYDMKIPCSHLNFIVYCRNQILELFKQKCVNVSKINILIVNFYRIYSTINTTIEFSTL